MQQKDGLSGLPGIGPTRLEALHAAGITDDESLLLRFPINYIFFDEALPFGQCVIGERVLIKAKLLSFKAIYAKGMSITTAVLSDLVGGENSRMEAVWYNQPYLRTQLQEGQTGFWHGLLMRNRGKVQLLSPVKYPLDSTGVVPLYKPIPKLPQKLLRGMMQASLNRAVVHEYLPERIRQLWQLPGAAETYRAIHFPRTRAELAAALTRVGLEDLLLFQLEALQHKTKRGVGYAMKTDRSIAAPFLDALGFPLTGAQDRVLREILTDMESDTPMARLVEGDVGCGKTALAFAALYVAAQNGFQGAMMAPTEVLAQQHYDKACELMEPLGLKVALLTGNVKGKTRTTVLKGLQSGDVDLVIGTHALISDGVVYSRLGLIVTDEQHRFGVRQRSKLEQKGASPHVLVMSATPIPRTMALVLYADLDLSVVDELPPGRQQVITKLVPEAKREDMYGFLRKNAEQGYQAYVICPLVEETKVLDASNAVDTCAQLKKALPELAVSLLHGRMSGAEKEAVLEDFYSGATNILVSTTVIEVGVNVPNATVMVIENAERFGLAQLHQLRGRVGRGKAQSWCFLMAQQATERLRLLTKTGDGFEVARKDLEIRGPGEFIGTRQSGALDEGLIRLAGDAELMSKARDAALEILRDPHEPQNEALLRYAKGYMEAKGYMLSRN